MIIFWFLIFGAVLHSRCVSSFVRAEILILKIRKKKHRKSRFLFRCNCSKLKKFIRNIIHELIIPNFSDAIKNYKKMNDYFLTKIIFCCISFFWEHFLRNVSFCVPRPRLIRKIYFSHAVTSFPSTGLNKFKFGDHFRDNKWTS